MWGRKQLESANDAWYKYQEKGFEREIKSEEQEKGGKGINMYIYREREREKERKKRWNVKKRKRSGERNDKFDEIKRIEAMPMLTVCWYLCSAQ